MSKFSLTILEKRVIIILMSINLCALFVNYFALSPKTENSNIESFWFTDNADYLIEFGLYSDNGYGYFYSRFWPFIDFKVWTSMNKYRFRGIFAEFDHTEFLVYTFLIFFIVYIKKIW